VGYAVVRIGLLTSIVVVSMAARAQEGVGVVIPQPPGAKDKPLPQGSVSGHVTLADVHGPARGAKVMLFPLGMLGGGSDGIGAVGGPLMGVTGLDGAFQLRHVAPGEYVAVVFAAGYLSAMDGVMAPMKTGPQDSKALEKHLRETAPVVRVSGQDQARIDIELQRGAIFTGKVVYSDGTPATQLPVLLQNSKDKATAEKSPEQADVGGVFRSLLLHQDVTTDDQGHFRIAGVAAGSYRIAVPQKFDAGNADEEMMQALMPSLANAGRLVVYSGNTLHRKDARLYEVKAGDLADGIEITLPLNGLHVVRGSAAGKDGIPLNHGMLDLIDSGDPTISFHTTVGADGEFRFSGIPEGEYQLKATDGRIYQNAPPGIEQTQFDRQSKPTRAFADTTVGLAVQTTDVENFTLTLADTKLPDPLDTPLPVPDGAPQVPPPPP